MAAAAAFQIQDSKRLKSFSQFNDASSTCTSTSTRGGGRKRVGCTRIKWRERNSTQFNVFKMRLRIVYETAAFSGPNVTPWRSLKGGFFLQTVSKSRQSSGPSAPLIDDATLGKKLTPPPQPRSMFNLHFNAFVSAWEFCLALFKI